MANHAINLVVLIKQLKALEHKINQRQIHTEIKTIKTVQTTINKMREQLRVDKNPTLKERDVFVSRLNDLEQLCNTIIFNINGFIHFASRLNQPELNVFIDEIKALKTALNDLHFELRTAFKIPPQHLFNQMYYAALEKDAEKIAEFMERKYSYQLVEELSSLRLYCSYDLNFKVSPLDSQLYQKEDWETLYPNNPTNIYGYHKQSSYGTLGAGAQLAADGKNDAVFFLIQRGYLIPYEALLGAVYGNNQSLIERLYTAYEIYWNHGETYEALASFALAADNKRGVDFWNKEFQLVFASSNLNDFVINAAAVAGYYTYIENSRFIKDNDDIENVIEDFSTVFFDMLYGSCLNEDLKHDVFLHVLSELNDSRTLESLERFLKEKAEKENKPIYHVCLQILENYKHGFEQNKQELVAAMRRFNPDATRATTSTSMPSHTAEVLTLGVLTIPASGDKRKATFDESEEVKRFKSDNNPSSSNKPGQ